MVKCLVLHDVYSQSQHSSRQRREELINERDFDEEGHDDSDSDNGDMQQTVLETQEVEEVYHINIDDDTSSARQGISSRRLGGTSQISTTGGSREGRRRQSFETTIQDTIAGYTEFQRLSLQQLRPGAFDQADYDEWKKAEAIFLTLQISKDTKFYWACLNTLKVLGFWRKYFIDITGSIDEDKLQLLEPMTSVSRNNQDVPKQLGSNPSFGSPNFGGLSYGNPSSSGGHK
ncbi:uncharacterized protein LOC112082937 [Eutrema salsugineum]|uniref:uncharacterized protein LOC112082937 n=1 Tax=Eutrema salsugineum TaxID=72664 RepID=UPI000CED0832|nr:uncharacterized protein LOC112082937 [Eutrema salsugineum]